MPCGSCNQPGIYRSPSAPANAAKCVSNACGFNKTNELGYILRDHAFSVVTAQQIVQEDNGESGCPVEHDVCLRLPCDIVSGPTKWTTPLVLADGTPFFLRKGYILQKIVVAKNCENDLDDNVSFILGTLGCNCAESEPQRFIQCPFPLTGCILNQVCAVKILCGLNKPICAAVVDYCNSQPDECEDPCGSVGSTFDGCTPGDSGATGYECLASGERQDSMIGLTVLCGNLKTYQLRVFVQYLSTCCSGQVDICNPCF